MLRTVFVFVALAIGWGFAFQSPLYAASLYLWIAYFRPESWAWKWPGADYRMRRTNYTPRSRANASSAGNKGPSFSATASRTVSTITCVARSISIF